MQRILAIAITLAFLVQPAEAVVVSRVTTFESGTPIVADDLNSELDNILDAINGNLDNGNFPNLAIATGDIATASIITDKLNDGSVTTAKIANNAVTRAKLAVVGQQISSSSGVAQYASNSEAAVTNLSATITSTGRPVWVGLQSSGYSPGQVHYRHNGGGATGDSAMIGFKRSLATVNQASVAARDITNPGSDITSSVPCSSFWFLDTPASGSNAYTVWARTASADSGIITIQECKLVLFEL